MQGQPAYTFMAPASSVSCTHHAFLGSLVSFTKPSSGPACICLAHQNDPIGKEEDKYIFIEWSKPYLNNCNYPLYATSDFILSPFLPLTTWQQQCLEERFHALGIDILFSYKIWVFIYKYLLMKEFWADSHVARCSEMGAEILDTFHRFTLLISIFLFAKKYFKYAYTFLNGVKCIIMFFKCNL